MLPALKSDRLRLADVFPSCLAAISGEANPAQLPPVRAAVVVLVDGLGAAALKARAGHARTLSAAMGARDVIESGFPTTTASALVTLATGVAPGQHGVVSYLQLDGDRLARQLDGPASGVPASVFAAAASATFIAPQRYRDSAFTRAVLADADFVAAATIDDRVAAALSAAQTSRGLIYVYVPELDSASHAHGWESSQWTSRLEQVDGAIAAISAGLPNDVGMLVTADHGVIDVPETGHIHYDLDPALMAGVAHVGGEPRCLQLYFDGPQPATVEAWRQSEGERSWVVTRNEAIDAGWFGTVAPHVVARIGDLLIAARKSIAYYPSTAGSTMIGQHGSWSPEEVRVPLLRFGAFRKA
jgi:predicted AlkP superfamily pyrophosphatase or phosphodiesterase